MLPNTEMMPNGNVQGRRRTDSEKWWVRQEMDKLQPAVVLGSGCQGAGGYSTLNRSFCTGRRSNSKKGSTTSLPKATAQSRERRRIPYARRMESQICKDTSVPNKWY